MGLVVERVAGAGVIGWQDSKGLMFCYLDMHDFVTLGKI